MSECESKSICGLCLLNYETDGQNTRAIACGHVFHKDCIEAWQKTRIREQPFQQPTCPLCNFISMSVSNCPPSDSDIISFSQPYKHISLSFVDGRPATSFNKSISFENGQPGLFSMQIPIPLYYDWSDWYIFPRHGQLQQIESNERWSQPPQEPRSTPQEQTRPRSTRESRKTLKRRQTKKCPATVGNANQSNRICGTVLSNGYRYCRKHTK